MSETITYLRAGRKNRATGTIVRQYPGGAARVKPTREEWGIVLVTAEEIAAGKKKRPIVRREKPATPMDKPTRDLPFVPPFRVISEYRCGTDAHIVDEAGNIIIESSQWATDPERKHKQAMELICDALNSHFPPNAKVRDRSGSGTPPQNQPS